MSKGDKKMAILDWTVKDAIAELAVTDKGTKLYAAELTEAGAVPASGFKWLVPVTAIPATGQDPATIEATEMDKDDKGYKQDRDDPVNQVFSFNRTAEKWSAAKQVCDGKRYAFLTVYGDGEGDLFIGTARAYKKEMTPGSTHSGTLVITPQGMPQDKSKTEVDALIAAA